MKRLLGLLAFLALAPAGAQMLLAIDSSIPSACQVDCGGPMTQDITWTPPSATDSFTGVSLTGQQFCYFKNDVFVLCTDLSTTTAIYVPSDLEVDDVVDFCVAGRITATVLEPDCGSVTIT